MKAGIQHFATRSPVHSWSRLCIERRICLSFCYLASTPSSIRGLVVSFFVTPSLVRGYRNINLLSIDYAFQPHLRSRLTQGGRTFPWKPWSIGVTDSHCHFATHTGILTSIHSSTPYGIPSTRIERSPTTLDYSKIHSFGIMLSPGKFSAQGHSTSELLRTLSRVAASKPTS